VRATLKVALLLLSLATSAATAQPSPAGSPGAGNANMQMWGTAQSYPPGTYSDQAPPPQWRRYSLPANVEISIPDNWRTPTPAEQSQMDLDSQNTWGKVSPRAALFLTDFNASGVIIGNITVTELPSDNPDDREVRTQEIMAQLRNNADVAAKTVELNDKVARTEAETKLSQAGLSVNWLGTEIAQVGALWAFVSRYEWTLPITAGPFKKEEVFSVVQAKIWNDHQACVIRIEHSKNFPEMAPLSDLILSTVRTARTTPSAR
jgi:hypothetical protein